MTDSPFSDMDSFGTDANRHSFLKMVGTGTAAVASLCSSLRTQVQDWDKTFPKSDAADQPKVEFTIR